MKLFFISCFRLSLRAIVVVLIISCSSVKQEPLPVLGTLPEFSLTERSGEPFGLKDLRGQVWVADFIFTNCAGTCPIMTTAMTDIQKTVLAEKLDDVKLVSITVDPERDTPEVLQRFADGYGALTGRWYFLTGDGAAIQQLANKGFLLSAATGGSPEEPIIHSNRFVLVDRQGRIRGYYDGTEEEGVKQLLKDLKKLYLEAAPEGKAS
jgi:cytochrome oxidase Cu insertion factor (SCO1/SenC/PrrC family)